MPRAESLLGGAAALVGAIGVASSLTPAFAGRYDVVRGVLPPGVPNAARVFALAFGVALIWLSRSLARRRRRAWQIAVLVVIGSAIAHLAKGLDVEEAASTLVLLAALLHWRSRFTVPGNTEAARPLFVVGLLAAAIALVTLSFELRGNEVPQPALRRVPGGSHRARLLGTLHLAAPAVARRGADGDGTTCGARARRRFRERQPVVLRAQARQELPLLAKPECLPRVSRRRGRRVDQRRPGRRGERVRRAPAEFQGFAHAHGWRLAVVGALGENLPRYERLGMRAIAIGDEAILVPAEFSLEGRSIRKVRQSVSRLTKAGYRFRVVGADDIDPGLRAQARCCVGDVAREPGRAGILDGDGRPVRPRNDVRHCAVGSG